MYRYIYLSIPLSPVYTCLTCGLAGNIVTIVVVLDAISAGEEPLFAPVDAEQENKGNKKAIHSNTKCPLTDSQMEGVSLHCGTS